MSYTSMNEAKQLYMEHFGEAIVTNSYLKIAVAVLSLVILGLVILDVRTLNTFHDFKPLVIRIDELGRAQAVAYDAFAYKPEDKEAKYFLTQFCELYYRRNRYTVNDDFTKAFYFLDGKLGNDIMAAYKNDKAIENFLSNPSSPEVDIDVQQVALECCACMWFRSRNADGPSAGGASDVRGVESRAELNRAPARAAE